MTDVKNLGTVRALHIGTIPPANKKLLWYDTNVGINIHKYWDVVSLAWSSFLSGFTPTAAGGIYFSDGSGIIGDSANLRWKNTTKTMSIGGIVNPVARLEIKGIGDDATTQVLKLYKENGDLNFEFFDDGSLAIYNNAVAEVFKVDPNDEIVTSLNVKTTGRTKSSTYTGIPGVAYVDFSEHDSQQSRMRIFDNGNVLIQDTAPLVALPNAPNTDNALLDLNSTTKGFMVPRMTQAQRLAIPVTADDESLMVYQTNGTIGLYIYKPSGAGWTFVI